MRLISRPTARPGPVTSYGKRGVFISASGVRSVWLRHGLACFAHHLKALENKVAEEGIVLTEAQVATLEKKQHDDQACSEIDTPSGLSGIPGYLLRWHF